MTTSKPSKKNKWTRHYRDDKGVWEDVCIHGVGHEKGVHGCDGCCVELNKPSKKTEWETEFTKKFGYWLHGHLCTETSTNGKTPLKPAIEFIRSLLHQRDNEIREKIQGTLKYPTGHLILDNKIKKILTYLSKGGDI